MNQGDSFWGTTNIKVASVVAACGANIRPESPVTRTIREDGTQQVTFWFEADGRGIEAKNEMERFWSEMLSDSESPVRYMRAALENRDTLLGLVKRVEPIRIIRCGGQTLLVAENARPEMRRAILKKI